MLRRPSAVAVAALLIAVPLSGCADLLGGSIGDLWTLELIQADLLQARGLTGKGVKVAIVDTGIDLNHPEFRGLTIEWADLVHDRPQAYDDNGHGTHVAGLVVAQGTFSTMFSGFKLKGAAPGVDLIAIKAIESNGRGDETRVAQAVNTAVSAGAHVIVLSLGGDTRLVLGTQTERAVRAAIDRGVFVVAAAGNLEDGKRECTVTSPASVEGVIAVGAVDRDGRIAPFSCTGNGTGGGPLPGVPVGGSSDPNRKPEVVAPGMGVLSAWKGGEYAEARGTSQAAPLVGGVLALLLEAKPHLKAKDARTVTDVKEKIMLTSNKVGPLAGKGSTAHDARYGYGILQGEALLRAYS